MGKDVSVPCTTGGAVRGYLAEANAADAPGVVVIQEWWGVQGQIRATCDRLAAEGLTALAPDLYGGKIIPYHDADAAYAEMASLDFVEATDEAVRGAARVLAARGGKVGLTGFCMGGAVTVLGAIRVPELAAAVCFYGLPPDPAAAAKGVRVPLQCHFASEDDWVTPAVADAFERALAAAGKVHEVHRYEGHHAFMNSDRPEAYGAEAARLAWGRCVAWFRRWLG
jgi:carboxymethylenebutenolidase